MGRQLNDGSRRDVGGHQTSVGLKDGQLPGVRITTAEAAALQSYPPDFRWDATLPNGRPVTKGKIGLVIGNAVPVLMAQAALEALWKEES